MQVMIKGGINRNKLIKLNNVVMKRKQSGAVLVVSLILLLVLTILALSTSENVLLQEKLAFAVTDGHKAIQSSDAALIKGEDWVSSPLVDKVFVTTVPTAPRSFIDTTSLATQPDPLKGLTEDDWNDDSSQMFASSALGGVDPAGNIADLYELDQLSDGTSADYYVEYLGRSIDTKSLGYAQISLSDNGARAKIGNPNVHIFQVVARGKGRNDRTVRVIRSIYGKQID